MLADGGAPQPERQGLIAGLHRAGEQFLKLIDFIARHLPRWRDDPRREPATAEDALSDQLCDFLNAEARNVPGVESFQFQRETRDDAEPKRNLDISAKPAELLVVESRHYSIYDIFLPIECKRLPMPEPGRADRDHREYLYDQHKSAGGVQRFKAGHHGANHVTGAIIGYVQDGNVGDWPLRINGWVTELVSSQVDGWSSSDVLSLDNHDQTKRAAMLNSHHTRVTGSEIELRHLWIEM